MRAISWRNVGLGEAIVSQGWAMNWWSCGPHSINNCQSKSWSRRSECVYIDVRCGNCLVL